MAANSMPQPMRPLGSFLMNMADTPDWTGYTDEEITGKKAAEQPQDELGSKGLRDNVEKPRKSKPGGSLITGNDKPRRKKIYGMGGSQGKEKSGTVKKPTLGGE